VTIEEAARNYLLATRAIHETHGSTDVHGHGGFSGQALTNHCAWECGATGVRYVTGDDGMLYRIEGTPPHLATLSEWHAAEAALIVALQDAAPNPD
jgi:hypothetical protein